MVTVSQALALALRHHQAGQWAQAETIYRSILQADPQQADALHLLGVLAHQQGQPQQAVEHIGRAVALRDDAAIFHNNLGLACRALGRLDEAAASFRRAIELQGEYANAWFNLGLVLRQQGQLDAAITHYRRAIALQPDFADAHNNLGSALRQAGRLDEALACYRCAIQAHPAFVEAHYNLAGALREAGRLDDAIEAYHAALRLSPDFAAAHNNLGLVLAAQKNFSQAAVSYRRAIELKPDLAEAHNNLGAVLASLGHFLEAAAVYRRAIELGLDSPEVLRNLGSALRNAGQLEEAADCLRRSLQAQPDHAETCNLLGNVLKEQGQIEQAIVEYRKAMQADPALVDAHSNFLLSQQYRPDVTAEELAAVHARWDEQYGQPLRGTWRAHGNSPDPTRPLRLGFVSADFGHHPVGYFLIRTLENLDREQCETFCYADRKLVDGVTRRFQAAAKTWRDTSDLPDERLAQQVAQDQVDILFELSGHTYGNRLQMFARKPAPVQISWIGYEGTTGLRAIDYLLADVHLIPPGSEHAYPESILRLPGGYVCYDPPAEAPAVGPLPADARGYVTFGSFNNPAKLTDEVLRVWAEILGRVAHARLVLKYHGLDDAGTRRRLIDRFAGAGVAAERLELRGWSAYEEFLAAHNAIDVALDPFPFSGGATTCNALWMGVPVITCPGRTFASRHGLSYLSALGMTETIARDPREYVERAVALGGDLGRLASLRASLRPRMAGSALCDGRRVAGNLERMLRGVWQAWCRESNPRT